VLSSTAGILGQDRDAEGYARLHAEVAAAFNDAFFDAEAGHYVLEPGLAYSQTANVMPLAFGLVPAGREAAVAASIVDDIQARDGHLNTGIQGTRYLLPVLSDLGFADVAYRVATQRTFPSWGHWLEHGATSLYENWSLAARSRNHHFFGSIVQWFYEHLAGIKPAAPGFRTIQIKPQPPRGLGHARAEVDTVMGRVSSS
jgi:alpha-L-rhamnosidase